MNSEQTVANLAQKAERLCYGKYLGFVVRNDDPDHLGRLTLRVPKVFGPNVVTGWALPCVPYGGGRNQGFLCIPEPGAMVLVEFMDGEPGCPLWVGTCWGKPGGDSELPKPNNTDGSEQDSVQSPPTRKIIKTQKGHTIQFEDADGEEMVTIVEATHKHVVTLDKDGIQITDGVNGNKILMGQDGIQLGSSGASEHFVLGNQFATNVENFLKALTGHTHTSPMGSTGAPIPPPPTSLTLDVPLSAKHKVE